MSANSHVNSSSGLSEDASLPVSVPKQSLDLFMRDNCLLPISKANYPLIDIKQQQQNPPYQDLWDL